MMIESPKKPKRPKTPGSGRKKNSRNKATVEREERALKELAEQRFAAGRKLVLAKDELLEMIPVVKDMVAAFQSAAIANGKGMPDQKGFNPEKWSRYKEWAEFLAHICYRAADFQSPKYRAIAVAAAPGDLNPGPQPKMIEARNVGDQDRERIANSTYLKLVKG